MRLNDGQQRDLSGLYAMQLVQQNERNRKKRIWRQQQGIHLHPSIISSQILTDATMSSFSTVNARMHSHLRRCFSRAKPLLSQDRRWKKSDDPSDNIKVNITITVICRQGSQNGKFHCGVHLLVRILGHSTGIKFSKQPYSS